MSIQCLDYDILAEKMLSTFIKSSSFSAQVVVQMGPKIHENMAKSISVLVPNLCLQCQAQASVSHALRSLSPSSGPFILDSIDAIDVSEFDISPRW
jgi:hypothetical protein